MTQTFTRGLLIEDLIANKSGDSRKVNVEAEAWMRLRLLGL